MTVPLICIALVYFCACENIQITAYINCGLNDSACALDFYRDNNMCNSYKYVKFSQRSEFESHELSEFLT